MSVLLPLEKSAPRVERKKTTVPSLLSRKGLLPVTALTAYDYTTARWVDSAGTDMILVGDSLGNVIQGHNSTLPVTMEHMLYHTQCVARAVNHALLIADMPFGSFQVSPQQTVQNAIRLIQEGGAAVVKLEGANPRTLEAISILVAEGIPVMGHVGLTPQSVHAMGGFKRQGKQSQEADRIYNEAMALEKAGAFAVVLECIPDDLAGRITKNLQQALSIGIGSGKQCDGQILVSYDLLGMLENSPPFAPRYAEFDTMAKSAIRSYIEDVHAPAVMSISQ